MAEIARVLKPGGRVQLADIIISEVLRDSALRDIDLWTGCAFYLRRPRADGRGDGWRRTRARMVEGSPYDVDTDGRRLSA